MKITKELKTIELFKIYSISSYASANTTFINNGGVATSSIKT